MTSVKWNLFWLHFSSSIFDFNLTVLTAPFMVLPKFAGFPIGVFGRFLGFGVPIQMYFVLTIAAFVGISILGVFENRYDRILLDSESLKKSTRFILYFINFSMAITFFIPSLIVLPEQENAVEIVLKSLPTHEFSYYEPLYVFAIQLVPAHSLIIITSLIIEFEILYFAFRISQYLRKENYRISKNTRLLQRKFFVAVSIQITVPIFLILFPICHIAYGFLMNYHNQILNNLFIFITANYGFSSSILLLFIHKPYRQVIIFCSNSNVVSTIPHSNVVF
ncbi:unnamed protein product [Caenorhabditis angaria]|uniref:Serpentine Receptor, class H n=1 Tax=Caenorhabditis angaria TaxID=860376 RepID=A0A9P1IF44_9PELO|nr:unnamed protein product [Caenorhabditis angaria]